MKNWVVVAVLFCGVLCGLAAAQSEAPVPILPETLRWAGPPNVPGLQSAWMLGGEQKHGPYIMRVKLAAGSKIPPHTHPDERNTTVLTGTIHVGFGAEFDEAKVVAVPAGAVYVAPSNMPHYVWAKDGDATYQEAGIGPTGTAFVKR